MVGRRWVEKNEISAILNSVEVGVELGNTFYKNKAFDRSNVKLKSSPRILYTPFYFFIKKLFCKDLPWYAGVSGSWYFPGLIRKMSFIILGHFLCSETVRHGMEITVKEGDRLGNRASRAVCKNSSHLCNTWLQI